MARTNDFPRVLWLVTSAWLVGCGRVGFGDLGNGPSPPLPDAPVGGVVDAATPAVDARPTTTIDAAPPIDASIPAGTPGIAFVIPTMTTTCGAGPTSVTAMVSNPGTADLVINKISPTMNDPFQVTGTFPMTIAPAASASFQITALAAVIGSDRGGDIKMGTLVVDANATTGSVMVQTTVMGANVVVFEPASGQLAFSDSSGDCPLPQQATIRNNGNVAVTVALVMPGTFVHAGTSSASVAAGGGTMARDFRPFSNGPCSGAGVIEYQVSGPNCGLSGASGASVSATFNITGTSSCFCS